VTILKSRYIVMQAIVRLVFFDFVDIFVCMVMNFYVRHDDDVSLRNNNARTPYNAYSIERNNLYLYIFKYIRVE